MTDVSDLVFVLPRPFLFLYSAIALSFSTALVLLSLGRGFGELGGWLAACLGLGALALRRPRIAPLAAGFLAFLLGFVRTYRGGSNLDLGLALIALAVSVYVFSLATRTPSGVRLDLGGMSLFAIATWSVLSLVFAVARIRSFAPAPGFAYRTYSFNALGFPSDEAVLRAVLGAATAFVWFGLYEWARSERIDPKTLNVAVFMALLVDALALVVQRYDPHFLLPAGLPAIGRLNGLTSFCYALGDVTLALFLLLPAWGFTRGVAGAFSAASLALLADAAIASGSRTALFTMLAAASLWALLRAARRYRARQRPAAFAMVAAVVVLWGGAGAAYVMTESNFVTPLGRLKEGIGRQGVVGHLVATRLSSYPFSFRVIAEYPLSGVGAGLYPAEVSKQHALLRPGQEMTDPFLRASYAPNQFLNTGLELGLPALLALAVVFVSAVAAALRSSDGDARDRAISVLALAGAFQLGPGLLNSEAVVFQWMVVGLAARALPLPAAPATVGRRASAALLAGAAALGLVGHLLSWPALAVDSQWQRLRWRLTMAMQPKQEDGQWSGPEATFVVDLETPAAVVRWHVGDRAVPDYHAEVSFFVDGRLVQRSLASSGQIRESVLPLPSVPGFKRISMRVFPPFVPATALGGADRRQLGVFVHSVSGGS